MIPAVGLLRLPWRQVRPCQEIALLYHYLYHYLYRTTISSTGLPSTRARRSRGSSSPACALLTPTAAPRGARSASCATSGTLSGTPHSVLRTQTSPTPLSSVALGSYTYGFAS